MARVTALNVNGKKMTLDVDSTVSLLSVLRNDLGLTGSKYGCGEGQCGACTVLIDGQPTRSCITQVGRATGKQLTTIEGLRKMAICILYRKLSSKRTRCSAPTALPE